MAITRDSRHKRRHTGGRRNVHKKKRKFETGRPGAMTKIGAKRVRPVRCRGGNMKFRALRLDSGNFSWGTETVTMKTRIIDVAFNASNNELVRTKTLVKNCIVLIDSAPFRQHFESKYYSELVKGKADAQKKDMKASSRSVQLKAKKAQKHTIEAKLQEQLASGRVLACISSRPGQSGRADGYLLEGKELEFYQRALSRKKAKK
eukprot:CAMPEP_0116942982 /NCGR_PEP_ID=MMETSP0467-20121206/34913_1 /TAXON_ID=283647 /ORGANISM="Mesodinium pulex, Strain SPMC105" /LENGTH=203 /DNA_ID=CAMNT_0004626071 /DNA_START=23 /DNA_END=634 /DNA_ORIENTATION=-